MCVDPVLVHFLQDFYPDGALVAGLALQPVQLDGQEFAFFFFGAEFVLFGLGHRRGRLTFDDQGRGLVHGLERSSEFLDVVEFVLLSLKARPVPGRVLDSKRQRLEPGWSLPPPADDARCGY